MEPSGFCLAGFETLSSIVDSFFKSDEYSGIFTRQEICDFLGNTCNKFLHSFGSSFKGRKSYDKYIQKESELLIKCRSTRFFDKSSFYIDSGGYQISAGLLNEREVEILIDKYHVFLQEHVNLYDRAFTLDITPGPRCKVLKNFDHVHEINLRTYILAKNFPDDVRKKMIYVHHFRTPKMWEIFNSILQEDDMFTRFENHSTGGIVANMASDTSIPCIIYVLPIVSLLKECIKHGRNYLNFHILGGANFRDILFYELFKIHILKKHNIKLNISYDSSAIFKGLLMGRYIAVGNDDGSIFKLDLRSKNLNMRCNNRNKKVIDVVQDIIDEMSEKTGLSHFQLKELYSEKTGSFFIEPELYLMFFVFYTYAKLQEIFKNKVPYLYKLYEEGNIEIFNQEMQYITQNINCGKITKKQKAKANSVCKSLDILSNLDQEYCKYIVNKFLAKDEFTNLLN